MSHYIEESTLNLFDNVFDEKYDNEYVPCQFECGLACMRRDIKEHVLSCGEPSRASKI